MREQSVIDMCPQMQTRPIKHVVAQTSSAHECKLRQSNMLLLKQAATRIPLPWFLFTNRSGVVSGLSSRPLVRRPQRRGSEGDGEGDKPPPRAASPFLRIFGTQGGTSRPLKPLQHGLTDQRRDREQGRRQTPHFTRTLPSGRHRAAQLAQRVFLYKPPHWHTPEGVNQLGGKMPWRVLTN